MSCTEWLNTVQSKWLYGGETVRLVEGGRSPVSWTHSRQDTVFLCQTDTLDTRYTYSEILGACERFVCLGWVIPQDSYEKSCDMRTSACGHGPCLTQASSTFFKNKESLYVPIDNTGSTASWYMLYTYCIYFVLSCSSHVYVGTFLDHIHTIYTHLSPSTFLTLGKAHHLLWTLIPYQNIKHKKNYTEPSKYNVFKAF